MWIHVSLDMVFSRMNIQWYGIVFALSAKQYLFGSDRRFSATAPCEGWHIAQDWFLNYFKVAYVSPTYVWHQHHLSLFRFVKSICSSLMASLRISRAYCFKMIEGNLSCNSQPCSFWRKSRCRNMHSTVLFLPAFACCVKAIADLRVQNPASWPGPIGDTTVVIWYLGQKTDPWAQVSACRLRQNGLNIQRALVELLSHAQK